MIWAGNTVYVASPVHCMQWSMRTIETQWPGLPYAFTIHGTWRKQRQDRGSTAAATYSALTAARTSEETRFISERADSFNLIFCPAHPLFICCRQLGFHILTYFVCQKTPPLHLTWWSRLERRQSGGTDWGQRKGATSAHSCCVGATQSMGHGAPGSYFPSDLRQTCRVTGENKLSDNDVILMEGIYLFIYFLGGAHHCPPFKTGANSYTHLRKISPHITIHILFLDKYFKFMCLFCNNSTY